MNKISWYNAYRISLALEDSNIHKEAGFKEDLSGIALAVSLFFGGMSVSEAAEKAHVDKAKVEHAVKKQNLSNKSKQHKSPHVDTKKQNDIKQTAKPSEDDAKTFIARVLYAEGANVSQEERSLIAQLIKNRIGNSAFGNSSDALSVVKQKNAFTSINDPNNKQFAKTKHPETMKPEEKVIWNQCLSLAQSLVDGSLKSDPNLLAYHDSSISKPKSWENNKYFTYTPAKETNHYTFYKVQKKPSHKHR